MTATSELEVRISEESDAPALGRLAARRPLAYNDFASIAQLRPAEPRVWIATFGDEVRAAAIDDGMAMSIAGDEAGLTALRDAIPDIDAKLVIAGRSDELDTFVAHLGPDRRLRPEHFMAVTPESLAFQPEAIPLRVAEEPDIEMLVEARASALEEEYGLEVDRNGQLFRELHRALERAVGLRGVAVWVEDDKIAFTAQLIAKTDDASTFGDLYTDPALRGEGRATRGLTAFCAWLMTESRHVTLRVGIDNTPAVRLYERTGFATLDSFCTSLKDGAQPGIPG